MTKLLRWLPLVVVTLLFSHELTAQCNEPEPPGTGPNACNEAPLFCSEADFDGYCSTTESTGVGICPAPFCGSCENYHFMSFIANSNTIELLIEPSDCQGAGMGSGIQAQIYSTADCVNFQAVSNCESPGAQQPITVVATPLTPGQVYYLMIDGWAGDVCDYQITVIQGVGDVPIPVLPGPPTGPIEVCPGAEVSYSVPMAPGATDYEWEIIPAIGAVTSGQGTENVTITWTGQGPAQICVTPSNACEEGLPLCMAVISTPIPPGFEEVDLCLGESVECQGQTLTGPGAYPVTYESYLGCDSTITCIVNGILPVIDPPMTMTICSGDNVVFCGETYDATGGYTCESTGYQGCDSISTLILTVLEAEAVIAPPPILGCGATTITLDGTGSTTIPASSESVFTYLWTASNGGNIVGPNDGLTVEVNAAGDYTFTVTQELDGVQCTDMVTVTVTEDTAVPDDPTVNGPDPVCQNDVATYNATPAGTGPAPTGYTWSVTQGTFVDNGSSIDVTWTGTGTGQVCVTADNDCGPSGQVCIDVVITPAPADPALVGPTSVCEDDIVVYEVNPTDPNTTSYNWTVTGGASFTDNGSSIDVDFSGASDGQVCVEGVNSCGTSNQICISFVVTNLPTEPTVTGDDQLCEGEIGTYDITPVPGATDYIWTTPNGEPIVGQGTPSISVDWTGSTGGQVCVQVVNGCGTSPAGCLDVTVDQLPVATISGGGDFCAGSGDVIDLTITINGTPGPWDVTVLLNGGSPSVVNVPSSPFTFPVSTAGDYTLQDVTDTNSSCTGSVSGTATVIENPLPTADLSGSGSICAGSGETVDLTVDLTGTPNWSIVVAIDNVDQAPITGITASPFTLVATQGGTYTITSVTDGNGCTNAGTGSSVIDVNTAVTVSNIMTPCDGTGTQYTVSFEINGGDAGSYFVDPPGSGTITPGTPAIFTSNPIISGGAYNFTVSDANGCSPVTVSGTEVCNCLTEVGTMDQTALTACGTDCLTGIYDSTNEMQDANDTQEFILHEGSGLSIVNEIARNTTGEFCYDMGAGMIYGQTYYISAVVGNDLGGGTVDLTDPCLAVAQGTPVTFFEVPTGDLSGDQEICEGASADLTIDLTGPSPWTIEYDDGSGSGPFVLTGITANPYTLTVAPTATTTYTLTDVSNANCPGVATGTATVTVNTAPVVTNFTDLCNPTATGYTISFEISAGDPGSYTVDPPGSGTITPGTPAIFTSNEIPANLPYDFLVYDMNGCDTLQFTGSVICDCTTEVGEMDLNPILECGDGPVSGVYDATNEVLDGDDVQEFILHNGSGNTIGYPIIASNTTGDFSFDGGTMTYGTTYYISAIVGNDDGSGGVDDMNDPCLAVAPGTPVTFYEVPTATLSGDPVICLGETATLSIALTGDSPWDVIITDGTTNDTIIGINSTNYNYNISPSVTANYTIVSVNDQNCPGLISGTGSVTVNEAPVVNTPTITINNTNTGYEVCFTISGGVPPYSVFNGSTTVTVDSVFCSVELGCGTSYNFEVDDANACGPVIVADGPIDCSCTSQVGDMVTGPAIEVCGSIPAIATYDPTNEVFDGNDVQDFILHNGDFVPILISTTPEFTYSGILTYGVSYFISARLGDDNGSGNVDPMDPCLSVSNAVEVIFYEIPTGTIAGNGDICAGQCFDLDVTVTGGVGPWTITYASSLGDTATAVINSSPGVITVCPPATAIYTIVEITDGNCVGTGTGIGTVTLQGVPFASNIITTIDPTNTFMTVCFDIVGGDVASYVVTGDPGTVTGASFCSDPLPCTNGSYFFLVQDGFQCITDTVQGPIICDCISNAGIMSGNLISLCEFEDVSAATAISPALDGNDALMYVLHTESTDALGTIIAINDTPDFAYDPALINCSETYYISSVVGDDDGTGTGMVDLTDDCLSVAEGTPVVFNCLPTATAVGDNAICEGGSSDLTFTLSGEGPFNVTLNDGTMDFTLTDISDGASWTTNPTVTTTYTLVGIEDITTGCINTASGDVTITVNSPVDAGTANADFHLCEDDILTISLADELNDEDPGGSWSETSIVPSTGGAFNAAAGTFTTTGQSANTYTFVYLVDGVSPCPDDSETVTVIIDPLPIADAGEQQEINCDFSDVEIGGPNTSPGAQFDYEWVNLNTMAVIGNEATIDVVDAGEYQLTVTNSITGCFSTDVVTVTESTEPPAPSFIIADVTCFGDSDGYILIDTITGGAPPYLCSFEGGAFTSQKQFVNLEPGTYNLVIQDSKGCEFEANLTVGEPEEITVELVGQFPGLDESIELGDSILLQILINVDSATINTIDWTPDDLVDCDSCLTNVVTPEIATTFSVFVEDESGCSDEDQLKVIVRKTRPVFIPNIFSPNNDGQNDIFFISGGESVAEIKSFLVFNRWGEIVHQYYNFQPNDPGSGWDGMFRGQLMNPAVFTYYAEIEFIDGLVELYEGDVTLVR